MFCLRQLPITKPIVVANATLPQKPDPSSSSSSSPEHINAPQKPSLGATRNATIPLPRNRLPRRPPQPSVVQIERIVGAGSFRDGEPEPRDSDIRKSVFDLFLGQAFEGPVERKLRKTGEWLVANGETKFRSSGKGILMFVFQWMIPIWVISFLIASGTIKLPFSSPLLDDLLL